MWPSEHNDCVDSDLSINTLLLATSMATHPADFLFFLSLLTTVSFLPPSILSAFLHIFNNISRRYTEAALISTTLDPPSLAHIRASCTHYLFVNCLFFFASLGFSITTITVIAFLYITLVTAELYIRKTIVLA